MQREEFDRLLAGYATSQLSEEDTARLMEAAMADQSLFNELADEDALRDTLANPQMKDELLRALAAEEKQSFWSWLRKPQVWALAGTAAIAGIAFLFVIQPQDGGRHRTEIAQAPQVAPKPAQSQPPGAVEQKAPVARKEIAEKRSDVRRESAEKPPERSEKSAEVGIISETVQLKKDMEPQKETKAESVAVAAAPPPPVPASAFRSMDATVPTMAKANSAGAVRSTLQYTVLRRNEQGEFIESPPGAVLDKGDAIKLAVTSSGRGYISLTEAGSNRPIHFGFAEPGVRYVIPTTGAVTLDAAATEKRMRLSFMTGTGNVSSQSSGGQSLMEQNTGNLANMQQNAGPLSQSTIEVVVRTR